MYDVTSDGGTNFVINTTFAGILQSSDDPITPGFNTPHLKLNKPLVMTESRKDLNFLSFREMRSAFDWESNFVDGARSLVSIPWIFR